MSENPLMRWAEHDLIGERVIDGVGRVGKLGAVLEHIDRATGRVLRREGHLRPVDGSGWEWVTDADALRRAVSDDGQPELPAVGTTVRDASVDRIGRVVAHEGGQLRLRPLDGTGEWSARPEGVEPVRLSVALTPLVAEANRRATTPR